MQFKNVFIAVFLGTALIVAAIIVNGGRPDVVIAQPHAEAVEATGKCADCHREETSSIVHQYEISTHAREGVTCLDCHNPIEGQESEDHRDFTITTQVTSGNCRQCHATEYEQYNRSRHGAPAWAAVHGREHFTEEQIAHAEEYHPGSVDRNANGLANLEGDGAHKSGCEGCHDIGKPNPDGSIGTCIDCHSRHSSSIALARSPETCGQCHMGPDHSQLEIYKESLHGVLFTAQRATMDLSVSPDELTTEDMPIPTCSTCHMSGLDGMKTTHDVTERLSWYLYAPVSAQRPGYTAGQDEMQELCTKCHVASTVETLYEDAETVVRSTNEKVARMRTLIGELREEGLLTPQPFDELFEFMEFDYWHYFGRTAKHGAFMGGADFVQWHGNYELLLMQVEMEEMAAEMRAEAAGAH